MKMQVFILAYRLNFEFFKNFKFLSHYNKEIAYISTAEIINDKK